MLKITFEIGGDNIEVVIKDNDLLFFDVSSGTTTTIEGLRLSKAGCIKEFPDLEDNPEWKVETVNRFKKKMRTYENELDKMNYIKSELIKQGYKALFFQRAGFRPSKFKEDE